MSGVDFESVEISNRKMREIVETARAAAGSPAHVLIIGAPGTGKTSLARWIYRQGQPGRPFVVLQVRELRDRLQDLALCLSEARGGTLLIEDIDLASPALQGALFDALDAETQQGEATRLICTSRRELRSLARQDLFRQDLYYRMTVLTLELPALDQRREDLPALARFMVEVSGILHGKPGCRMTEDAMDKLHSWAWPGNIRELENVLERAMTLAKSGVIGADQIQFEDTETRVPSDLGPGMSLSEVERRLILQTLELTAQNRTRAAQLLGISIRTLRNKLNEYRESGATI